MALVPPLHAVIQEARLQAAASVWLGSITAIRSNVAQRITVVLAPVMVDELDLTVLVFSETANKIIVLMENIMRFFYSI